jgi:Flp pilus assembly protein TadG
MVEFAIVAPLLLVFLFGIVDFGRVIYVYVTLNQAVNEGARAAIRDSASLPSNDDVERAVRQHAVDVSLANPCTNGPITSAVPPANQGWIYITEPFVAGVTDTIEQLSSSLENAPGSGALASTNPPTTWKVATASCSAINPAHDHAPLQITIRYNFVPFTPLIRQWTTNSIIITAAAIYSTEY